MDFLPPTAESVYTYQMPRNADSWRKDRGRQKSATDYPWFGNAKKRSEILLTAMERRAGLLRRQTGTERERRERVIEKLLPKSETLDLELRGVEQDHEMDVGKQLAERRFLKGRLQHIWITEKFPEILEAILAELTDAESRPRTLRQIASGLYPRQLSIEVNPLLRRIRVGKNTVAQWLYRVEAIARELHPEEYKAKRQPPPMKSTGVDEAAHRRIMAHLSKRACAQAKKIKPERFWQAFRLRERYSAWRGIQCPYCQRRVTPPRYPAKPMYTYRANPL